MNEYKRNVGWMCGRMATLTERVKGEKKNLLRRETNEERLSVEMVGDLIFLSNKVRISGPATVPPSPFLIPAIVLAPVLRNKKKASTLKKKKKKVP